MSTGTVEKQGIIVVPFAVEVDHPRNDDVLLQSIINCRLRSAIDGSRPAIDAKTGDLHVPNDQARALASFPRTPGMQLHVNPAALTYEIIDPLEGNEEMCDRIVKFLKRSGAPSLERIKGVPKQNGKLDINRMKTLCREIIWLSDERAVKAVKGKIPRIEDVEELPGEFLLNPGSRVPNTQPQFEADWDNWVQQLSRSGG